jgi:hypothetical protein
LPVNVTPPYAASHHVDGGETIMRPDLNEAALEFLLARSGLSPTPKQQAELSAIYPHIAAMTALVRKPRGRMAEPAVTYGFAEEDLA